MFNIIENIVFFKRVWFLFYKFILINKMVKTRKNGQHDFGFYYLLNKYGVTDALKKKKINSHAKKNCREKELLDDLIKEINYHTIRLLKTHRKRLPFRRANIQISENITKYLREQFKLTSHFKENMAFLNRFNFAKERYFKDGSYNIIFKSKMSFKIWKKKSISFLF
jgi:hypothetical protein